jgi:hypothetical protein
MQVSQGIFRPTDYCKAKQTITSVARARAVVGPVRAKRVSRDAPAAPHLLLLGGLTGGEPAALQQLSIMGRAAVLLAIFLLCHLSSGESSTFFLLRVSFVSKSEI